MPRLADSPVTDPAAELVESIASFRARVGMTGEPLSARSLDALTAEAADLVCFCLAHSSRGRRRADLPAHPHAG